MKGHVVHVYSREKPADYGKEKTNSKELLRGKMVRTVRHESVVAYCKHSIGVQPVVGRERDLIVDGQDQEFFINDVLSGKYDSCIKNVDASRFKKGKSGCLIKECWTKNCERVDWLTGPAGRYCIVSGISYSNRIANSLKVASEVAEYWNPSEMAEVIFSEMRCFNATEQQIRQPVRGWCV